MKQPELGHKISEARKRRELTQAELAKVCNIDLRTIQRIENGEVTPRIYTLRILNENLGTKIDLIEETGEITANSSSRYWIGIVSGIFLFCLLPIMFFDYNIFSSNPPSFSKTLLRIIYISVHTFTVIFFYRSLFIIGKLLNNKWLSTAAVITILVVISSYLISFANPIFNFNENPFSGFLYRILFSVSSILIGVGFILIQKVKKELAMVAGVTQVLAGILYFISGIFGIFIGGIALIIQIVYLIQFQRLYSSSLQIETNKK